MIINFPFLLCSFFQASFVESFINPINASALRLDFANKTLGISMYIILPTKCINSLEELENTFQSFIPLAVERRMSQYRNVTVALPKFTIENVINFNPILTNVSHFLKFFIITKLI